MRKKVQPKDKGKAGATGIFIRVYKIVRRIPHGRVLTYGVISNIMDSRLSAQGVGWALKALPPVPRNDEREYNSQNVPWHRVVNSRGGISTWKVSEVPPGLQRQLLEDEGIIFGDEETIDLKQYLWTEGLSQDLER